MHSFKCLNDLNQLPTDDPAYPIVKHLVESCIVPYGTPECPYRPEAEGWIVLIEEGDVGRPLTDLWDDWTLLDIPWEGIMREGDYFQAVFLANNEFVVVFVIPDAPWINGELRQMIEENLDP
jgi:hypothetical protein